MIPRSPAGYRPSQQAGGTRAPCARRPGIASWPGSDLVVPFWRAPGERHRAPCRNPAIPRGNSWHHRQHGEPVRVRSRPAGHDGRVISAPCHALEQRAEGLRWCVCSVPAPPFRDGFCARRTKPPALDAQVCCEASFLAQPALCMHSSRAHYPAVRLERTDHGRLPFLACTRCPLFRSPRLCLAKSTQVCCALHTSAHTIQYACLNILSVIRGFCASPWPGHSVRGQCFIKTFSVCSADSHVLHTRTY